MRRIFTPLVASLAIMSGSLATQAEEFPNRTIELIFPWGPGIALAGSQILAEAMGEELGVSISVISTPGAAGTKSFLIAMNKPADGYTIIDGYVAALVLQPVLGNADYSYEDFTPLHSGLSNAFAIGTLKSDTRWANFEEMMQYCAEHPGELRYTTIFRNSLPHMVAAKALQAHNCVAQNIPYSGAAEGYSDLRNGVLDFGFVSVGEYQQNGDAYNIQLVLSELPESAAVFDGAPSIVDLNIDVGLTGLAPLGWDWWLVHKDTPPERVEILREAMAAAIARPEVRAKAEALGFTVLDWDWDQYEEVVAPVVDQLKAMGNSLKWEEEQLAKY